MSKEKRRFTRVPFQVEAELVVGDTTYPVDDIKNLSVGGCLVSMEANLSVGTVCKIAIKLGEPESGLSVEVDGKIVRTPPKAVAIQFTGVSIDNLHHLQNIVRYNSSDPDAIEKELHDNLGIT
jgi:hypothetical protein